MGSDVRFTWSLIAFAWAATVCTATGVLTYCYSRSLGSWRPGLLWAHEISGDAAAILLVWYLTRHLRKTWALRTKRPASWWTGVVGAGGWAAAAATGVWGQFVALEPYGLAWWIHAIGSLIAVVVVCIHAAWGYRARAGLV